MALMVFGIVLNRNGRRIDYLGASTPVEELEWAVGATRPDLVVLAATVRRPSSRSARSSPPSPGAPRSPLPEPAPRRRSRRRWGPSCWRATQ